MGLVRLGRGRYVDVSRHRQARGDFSATWNETYFTRESDPDDDEILNLGLIRVKEPKTRWRSARQQTVVIDDPLVIAFLRHRKAGARDLTEKIWPYSPATWQKRFLLSNHSARLCFLSLHSSPCKSSVGWTGNYFCIRG